MNVSRTSPVVPPRIAPPLRPESASSPTSGNRPTIAGAGLWDLLTPDEQEFFTRQTALGDLTYGPSRGGASRAPLGGRVDVKG